MISSVPDKILRFFSYRKSLFKIYEIAIGQNCFKCKQISKKINTFYDKLNAQFCKEDILSPYKEIENICEILLSDTIIHTSEPKLCLLNQNGKYLK